MPALDPLSGNWRDTGPLDSGPSRPLIFATTLEPRDLNVDRDSRSTSVRPRRLEEHAFYEPLYKHNRSGSNASAYSIATEAATQEPPPVGSDEWMQAQVARCVDGAKTDLKLDNLGLTTVSTRIADLEHLVTLPASFSPLTITPSRMTLPFRPSPSPARLSPAMSPGSSHMSANSSSFTRHVSAPASSFAFRKAAAVPATERMPSVLPSPTALLGSPVLTDEAMSAKERDGKAGAFGSKGETASPTGPARSPAQVDPKRQFGRSKTAAFKPLAAVAPKDISINLAQNQLSRLPSALFEISNLTSLSLRNNCLTSLPAAIGHLTHLKSLNIGINQIRVLPSTILDLPLTEFYPHPNPYGSPSSLASTSAGGRLLDPLVSHGLPRLSSLCLRVLLSPLSSSSDLPPMLAGYTWDAPSKGQTHPLLDPTVLHSVIPQINLVDCARILQSLRSTANQNGRHGASRHQGSFPRSHKVPAPDDAANNPFYHPCASPRHLEYSSAGAEHPTRQIFLHAAEERVEWRSVHGNANLPILWRGCSPGCLAFLELADEFDDDWDLDSEL